MNNQSAGASAYNNGTLQIMINRLGNFSDNLGNSESMTELQNGLTLRVNPKFRLKISSNRNEAFKSIRNNYIKKLNSPLFHYTINQPIVLPLNGTKDNKIIEQMREELQNSLKIYGIDQLTLEIRFNNAIILTIGIHVQRHNKQMLTSLKIRLLLKCVY